MKITEFVLAILGVSALVLSLIGIPGGNILAILSITLLAFLYFYLAFALFNGIRLRNIFKKESYKGVSAIRIGGTILSGFILSLALIGILFRCMMWPGASVMLIVSTSAILVLATISAIKYLGKKEVFYRNMLIRSIVIGLPVVLLYFNSSAIRNVRYRDNPELLQAIEKAEQDPENKELWRKVDSLKDLRQQKELGK